MKTTSELTPATRLFFFLGGMLAVAILLFTVYGDRRQGELSVGEPSPLSYVAPVNVQVADELATGQQRQMVRSQIREIYSVDTQTQQLVLAAIAEAAVPERTRETLQDAYMASDGVKAAEIPGLLDRALKGLTEEEQAGLRQLLSRRLLPSSVPDVELTEAARAAAAAAVRPVLETVQAGQLIVEEGEPLTAGQLNVLEATGLYNARADEFRQLAWIIAGCLLLGGIFAAALMLLWQLLARDVSRRQFLFLAVLTFAVMLGQRYALGLSQNFLFIMLLPLLVSILVSRTVGFLWGVWSAVLLALLVPAGPEFALVASLVGTAAVVFLAPAQNNRASLIVTAMLGNAVATGALLAMALLIGGYTVLAVLTSAAWLLIGGALAGLLSLALLPLSEHQFRFLTDFRLLELSNPGAPLLQRRLLEAPGTYQHSLVISNLVEQAVQAIGGNALLARVGALYHDIGKLRRPTFFVENQFAGENPHDRLSPHLSYLIITAHVRDGIELLREYGLPLELNQFVQEHHGTTTLTYFYKRALEATPSLDELNFRYPGPRPQSRETAVLMLADVVESASRSLGEAGQGDIRALIDRLVDQRLRDGQLAQTDLNFDDLEKIKDTFERMLSAILHRRVAYPTAEEIGRLRRGSAGSDTARNGGSAPAAEAGPLPGPAES